MPEFLGFSCSMAWPHQAGCFSSAASVGPRTSPLSESPDAR